MAALRPLASTPGSDHHVRRQHGQAGGDGPGMQVVHAHDAVERGQVGADLGQVDAPGAGFEQHVHRVRAAAARRGAR